MQKLGGSSRKDSAEAIHEKIQRIENLERDLSSARMPKAANNPRKVCGRVRGSDSLRILHLESRDRFAPLTWTEWLMKFDSYKPDLPVRHP